MFAASIPPWQERTVLLVGQVVAARYAAAHVLVAGLGGVGSWAAEFLCRAGIGRLTLADGDVVAASNRNRQLPALAGTEGIPKTEVMAARLREINPEVKLVVLTEFLRDRRLREVLTTPYDYVVDAIDSLSPKVFLLADCRERGLPVVSAMGAAGKLDPTCIRLADIAESNHCPLARMVRKRLHRLGIRDGIPVVYSPEPVSGEVIHPAGDATGERAVRGTLSCVTAAFGAACAAKVLRDLAAENDRRGPPPRLAPGSC